MDTSYKLSKEMLLAMLNGQEIMIHRSDGSRLIFAMEDAYTLDHPLAIAVDARPVEKDPRFREMEVGEDGSVKKFLD